MKNGRSLLELVMELDRQRNAKKDYLLDTRNLVMDCGEKDAQITMSNEQTNTNIILGVSEIAHNQIGQALGIPSRYYDKMRAENPELLAQNVNSWFRKEPKTRMIRTLDGNARAFLSERYRRIDNYEIAETVLPIIADMPDARISFRELRAHFPGAVRRAVVHQKDLKIPVCLSADALKAPGQVLFNIVDRHDHADRAGHHGISHSCRHVT